MHNRFPDGQTGPDDDGELLTSVGVDKNNVVRIDYSKPIRWVGFDPQGAADFAAVIIKHARTAAEARGIILKVTI